MPRFEVHTSREPGRLVVAPIGELDIATVDAVRAEIGRREHGEGLRLDLGGVKFLDTTGLKLVVEVHRSARDDGFALELLPAHPDVQRVFEIAGLDAVLPFSDRERGDG